MNQIKNAAGVVIEVDDTVAERRLARSVKYLMQDVWPHGAGECTSADQRLIDADPELAAFFATVALAGAWSDESRRVARSSVSPPARRYPSEPGGGPLTVTNICNVMPLWRKWGRLLIEAEKAKAAQGGGGGGSGDGGGGGPPAAPDPSPPEENVGGPRRR